MKIENMKNIRKDRGLSQRELAKRTGMSQPRVSNIETGLSVSPKLAQRFADVLMCDVADLRGFKLLLNAIKTLAIMHQETRSRDSRGRVVATLADYGMARDLLNDLLSQGIGATVSKEMRETVKAVKELTADADPAQEHTTNKAVAAELGLDKSSISTRVDKALTGGST